MPRWRRWPTSPTCARRQGPATPAASPRWPPRPATCSACQATRCATCAGRGWSMTSGLHGVPATILDKPGPLTGTERERMRVSAYYTERTLARPPALARIGVLAALASERLDGSGYHRGLSGTAIPASGRILAAADAYHAMIEPRPYRPALTAKQASHELRTAVRAGRLDPDGVDAVLSAAGQRPGKRRRGPAGLTPRELEVLTQLARGPRLGRSPTRWASLQRQPERTSSASTPRSARPRARPS